MTKGREVLSISRYNFFNKQIVSIAKWLCLADIVFFFLLIGFVMTDEKPPAIADFFFYTLKYALGFPLVLVNHNLPFFLLSTSSIGYLFIVTALVNNYILAILIDNGWKFIKRF